MLEYKGMAMNYGYEYLNGNLWTSAAYREDKIFNKSWMCIGYTHSNSDTEQWWKADTIKKIGQTGNWNIQYV